LEQAIVMSPIQCTTGNDANCYKRPVSTREFGTTVDRGKIANKYLKAGHSGRAVRGVGLGRLVAGIVGSNPAQGMDVCLRLSVLCCPV
jgi:hypothetical protein